MCRPTRVLPFGPSAFVHGCVMISSYLVPVFLSMLIQTGTFDGEKVSLYMLPFFSFFYIYSFPCFGGQAYIVI